MSTGTNRNRWVSLQVVDAYLENGRVTSPAGTMMAMIGWDDFEILVRNITRYAHGEPVIEYDEHGEIVSIVADTEDTRRHYTFEYVKDKD